jgi:hypothetical protein
MMFDPDDAQRLFELLANVEAAKAGRDFLYTIEKADGNSITGRVVERDDVGLGLLVESELGNLAESVAWDNIESIKVTTC